MKVNCTAISAGLVESEFFGHVKGAFTGALERRIGRFQLADGGTIFLDEVGELPLETQVKLLRVLQEGEFEPVGGNQTLRVNVRVIAATNRDLRAAVDAGHFRADLFYRLNVVPVAIPPLRERRADIPQLVTFFAARFGRRFGKRIENVAPTSMERLLRYGWPGNIRELQNVVERAVVLASGPVLVVGARPAGPAGGRRADPDHARSRANPWRHRGTAGCRQPSSPAPQHATRSDGEARDPSARLPNSVAPTSASGLFPPRSVAARMGGSRTGNPRSISLILDGPSRPSVLHGPCVARPS